MDLVENMQLNLFNGEEITFIESNMMLHDLFKASFEVILFLHPLYLVLIDLSSMVVNKLYIVFFSAELYLEGDFDALSCLGF